MLQYLPMIEVLFFNLLTTQICCHPRYTKGKTIGVLVLFSALFFGAFVSVSEAISFVGDGKWSLFGFIYLVPFRFLYKEKTPILFIIVCTCWIYSMGVFSLTMQWVQLMGIEGIGYTLFVENILFLSSVYPFYKWVVPRYIYIVENMREYDERWYRYIAISNSLNFFSLFFLHITLTQGRPSYVNLVLMVLFLSTIYVSYFTFYKIIMDAGKMDHLEQVAMHDSLTGLGNRTLLWEHLQDLIEQNEMFSVLFMDLDRFKQVNDQYGHLVGDAYLKHFARVSSQILRGDGRVYRFGGDEFIALYPGIIPQHIMDRLKECREWEEGAPCPFNQVSTGLLLCEPPYKTIDEILQQVDHSMYQKKHEK